MAQMQDPAETIVSQAADPQATGIKLPSIVDANVRRRPLGRVDQLEYLSTSPAIEEQPQDKERLESIQEIVCHIIWINAIGLQTLEHGWTSSTQIIGRYVWEEYKQLLNKKEVSFGEYGPDLYKPRMKSEIVEYVSSLTLNEIVAFIKHLRPSQFYGEILRVQVIQFDISTRAITAADKNPDLEIPEWYNFCKTKIEYLGQLSVDFEDDRHKLIVLLNTLQMLVKSIQRATKSSHLTSEHLKALKVQMEAFESYYPIAYSRVYGSALFKQHLITPKAERWWETDNNPESRHFEAVAKVAGTYHSSESTRSTLNFIVPTVSLLSVIPAWLAWRHGTAERGMPTDSDFYQAIAGSALQLLGLFTFMFPILNYPRLSRMDWFWAWILAGFSALCAVASVPLYLFLPPTTWSFLIGFAGAVAQTLIQLQVVNSI